MIATFVLEEEAPQVGKSMKGLLEKVGKANWEATQCPLLSSSATLLLSLRPLPLLSLYAMFSLVYLFTSSLLPLVVVGSNITASITAYTTNQCCGGYIQYNNVHPGDCLQNAGHPSVYGQSVDTKNIWDPDGLTAYAYVTGWRNYNCTDKAYEIRTPMCYSISEGFRATSWTVTEETYDIPWFKASLAKFEPGSVGGLVVEEERIMRNADLFGYFDPALGRERRVATQGSGEVLEDILDIYAAGDFSSLHQFEDCKF